MATPSYANFKANQSRGFGLSPETVIDRVLSSLSVLSTGQNPDGTAYTLPVSGALTVSGGQTPGDGVANPTDASDVRAFLEVWNGATWDRVKEGALAGAVLISGSATPSDALAAPTDLADVKSFGALFNGATFDRARSGTTLGSTLVNGPGTAGTPSGGVLTVQGQAGATAIPVSSAIPIAANVLAGFQVFTASTVATTVITIPATRVWVGTVAIYSTVYEVAAGTAFGEARGSVSTAGTTVTPTAGTYWECDAFAGQNAATGTAGTQGSNSIVIPNVVVVAPGGNSVTLQLTTVQQGTATRVAAMCTGLLQ